MNVKNLIAKIDENKLTVDMINFNSCQSSSTFVACDSIDNIDWPKLARKFVTDLCVTDRQKSYCQDSFNSCGFWTNAAISFKLDKSNADLVAKTRDLAMNYNGPKFSDAYNETEISTRRFSIKLVAQSERDLLFEHEGTGRIVINKTFLLLIKRYGIDDIASFTADHDLTCVCVRNAAGEMIGLIMGLNCKTDPLREKTEILEAKPTLDQFFLQGDSIEVAFDKPHTSNGKKQFNVRFRHTTGMQFILLAKNDSRKGWQLHRHDKNETLFVGEMDSVRALKSYCLKMATCMHEGKLQFVEFNSK